MKYTHESRMGNIARAKRSAIFFTIFSRAQCIHGNEVAE